MAAIILSHGVIRSMTRGAPAGVPSDGSDGSDTRMSLLDKLNLLRLVAEDPPPQLSQMLEQLRQTKDTASSNVFSRLRSLVEGSFEGT